MINAREQICTALEAVCNNVKMSKPEGTVELPLICYAEVNNTPVNMICVRLGWRVAVYARTFEELVSLTNQVDAVMTGLGYTRTSKTPDTQALVDTDLYLCRLNYSGLVNTVIKNVIPYST